MGSARLLNIFFQNIIFQKKNVARNGYLIALDDFFGIGQLSQRKPPLRSCNLAELLLVYLVN